ncbi:MAG: hypothetical protein AAGM22_08035 [Acidobacteriota bacterium]
MNSKMIRRLAVVMLAAASLLVPFLTLADPDPPGPVIINPDPDAPTFNEAYDTCFMIYDPMWELVQGCIDIICESGCRDVPQPTG